MVHGIHFRFCKRELTLSSNRVHQERQTRARIEREKEVSNVVTRFPE